MSLVKNEIAHCIDSLRDGRLTEQDLLRVSEVAGKTQLRQDVLWLQAENSSPVSEVVGMRIIEDGEISDGPADPNDWPYKTVLDAIRDGWRIIRFPEIALSDRRRSDLRTGPRVHTGEVGLTHDEHLRLRAYAY